MKKGGTGGSNFNFVVGSQDFNKGSGTKQILPLELLQAHWIPKETDTENVYKRVNLMRLGFFGISGVAMLPSATDSFLIQWLLNILGFDLSEMISQLWWMGSCAAGVTVDTMQLHFHLNHPRLKYFFSPPLPQNMSLYKSSSKCKVWFGPLWSSELPWTFRFKTANICLI